MNRQCGQKIRLYSCKPLRHRTHLSLQQQSDLVSWGLACKAKSFSGFVFKGRERERDLSEVLGAVGSLEAPRWTEGALDKESLALAFVPALPSHIFIKYLWSPSIPTKVTESESVSTLVELTVWWEASPWASVGTLWKWKWGHIPYCCPPGIAELWPL